jgi:hypothetical protein
MTAVFAKLMVFIYGLSIAGYVLLDGGHELLHAFKKRTEVFHNHDKHTDHNSDLHHHVEDHQRVFVPDTDQSTASKGSVKIFSFLLFFQAPPEFTIHDSSGDLHGNGLTQKLLTLKRTPLTPPPLG